MGSETILFSPVCGTEMATSHKEPEYPEPRDDSPRRRVIFLYQSSPGPPLSMECQLFRESSVTTAGRTRAEWFRPYQRKTRAVKEYPGRWCRTRSADRK